MNGIVKMISPSLSKAVNREIYHDKQTIGAILEKYSGINTRILYAR